MIILASLLEQDRIGKVKKGQNPFRSENGEVVRGNLNSAKLGKCYKEKTIVFKIGFFNKKRNSY